MTSMDCLLCAEPMSLSGASALHRTHRALGMKCCGQMLCQSCLYRHINSVIDEGITGQGRNLILCPMGCGQELTDRAIRKTIREQHPVTPVSKALYSTMRSLLLFSAAVLHWRRLSRMAESRVIWLYWNHSDRAQRDLERYEDWSLTTALRRTPDEIQRCPAPNCNYVWITNPLYRRHKQQHERRPTYLWYSPPKPEEVPFNWVEPEYVEQFDANRQGRYMERETRDGRRMVCAACSVAFCGLCRQPWEAGGRRRTHDGKSCQRYRQRLGVSASDSDFNFVASSEDCRTCPGCGLRTHRTDGCNHMTCPCGTEWCYVCEMAPWTPRHYACVDRTRTRQGQRGNDACTVM